MARRTGQWPALPPAGHASVDQPNVTLQERFGPEPQAFHHPGTKALDQYIRLVSEVQAALAPGCTADIERYDAPAAVHHRVRPARSALTLNANDIGPQIGQQHGAVRPRADAGELQHAQPGKRARA